MKSFKFLLAILTTVFVLSLTLPASADTGPPVPKTERFVIEKSFVSDVSPINIEAACDIGIRCESKEITYCEKSEAVIYLDRPQRDNPINYGFLSERLCAGITNNIRPPNKE